MIDGEKYIETVKEYYSFLFTEFNLPIINEKIRGNAFYDIQFGNEIKIISINYENIEDYFQVIIFILQNGKMPDYDDNSKALHLNMLTSTLLPKISKTIIDLNNKYFSGIQTKNELERKFLKSAKELRLLLLYGNIPE